MKNNNQFINQAEELIISTKISDIEKSTSGEIHVHITERSIAGDILEFAQKIFDSLGLHHTQDRNAVLILISIKSHKFAILGDEGIHKIFGQKGWDSARNTMTENFSRGDFAIGVIACVEEVGKVLREHFPKCTTAENLNEISNEISRS